MTTAQTIARNINLNNDVYAVVVLSNLVDVETTSFDSDGGYCVACWFDTFAKKAWEGLDVHGCRAVEYKHDGVTVVVHESRPVRGVWG